MSSYRYSSDANADIEGITLYIFDLNRVAAHHFLNVLEETCDLLARHPLLGRLRPEFGEGLRSFSVGNYLILYTPSAPGIDVARHLRRARFAGGLPPLGFCVCRLSLMLRVPQILDATRNTQHALAKSCTN